jgi:hypothetical protein
LQGLDPLVVRLWWVLEIVVRCVDHGEAPWGVGV